MKNVLNDRFKICTNKPVKKGIHWSIHVVTPSEIKLRRLSEPNKLETRVNFFIAGNGGASVANRKRWPWQILKGVTPWTALILDQGDSHVVVSAAVRNGTLVFYLVVEQLGSKCKK